MTVKPVRKAILVGSATVVVYLLVVVATTPALEPLAAISAAFQINSIVIFGMGIGIGLQIFLSEKSKLLGCRIDAKKSAISGNSGSTAMTSFFLFSHLFHWDAVVGGYTHCRCCQVLLEQECLLY